MNSAYTQAMQELSERRQKNNTELIRRTEYVRQKAPEYTEIEESLKKGGTALLRGVLKGADNFEETKAAIVRQNEKKSALLQRLNLPEDYLDEIYTCPKCRDTGFDEDGRRCECQKQLIMKYISRNSNMTEHMKGQTFKNFDYTLFANQADVGGRNPLKTIEKIKAYAEQFADTFDTTHENLFFMGNAGVGKTYLSSCIANRALERGKTVYYQTSFAMFELLEQIKFNKLDSDAIEDAVTTASYLKEADLLIIDDLGTEFITQYSTAALFDIINSRLVAGKSTILSSNLNMETLEEIYSGRLRSRLIGEYTVLKLIGQDLRLSKKLK